MKGKILDYSIQNSSGIISGEDGSRYEFTNAEWKSDKAPKANQNVDFEADEKNAKGIYLEVSSLQFDTDGLKSKFTDVKNSEVVGNITSQGVQNKFGFIVSLITALALFFPIIEIPWIGSGALIDGGMGKLLFVLLIISAFLFYSGMQHKFVKICVSAIAIIVLFQFYDLFSSLSSAGNMFGGRRGFNFFQLLRFGTPILILLTLILAYTGLKKNYKEALVKA
jgi:hypothetical protein